MGKQIESTLHLVFSELDRLLTNENLNRAELGSHLIAPCEIKVLGQMCLIGNPAVSSRLSLQHTGDLDALIRAEYFVVDALKSLLLGHGLIYDDDSDKVWLPPGSQFLEFASFELVEVTLLDPESALVSKAVKAKEKNKQLIQDAIGSGFFPKLADRIMSVGGSLEYFLED